MTVKELIEKLKEFPEDSTILIMGNSEFTIDKFESENTVEIW